MINHKDKMSNNPAAATWLPPNAAQSGETYVIVTNDKSVKEIVDKLFASDSNALAQ